MSDTIPAAPMGAVPPPPRRAPRRDLSATRWKVGLAALLGAVFTLSWFAIESPPTADAAPRPHGRRSRVAQARPSPQRQARADPPPQRSPRPREPRATRIRTRSS